jgi:hypothetical protein
MSKNSITFSLRDELKESFDGGSVTLPDGSQYDVKEALGVNGRIVLDPAKDRHKVTALAGYPALEYEVNESSSAKAASSSSASGKGDK